MSVPEEAWRDALICPYCDSRVSQRPANGCCPHCGGQLPAPAKTVRPAQPSPVRPTPPPPPVGIGCCPRCMSRSITAQKRGFRWGLACVGFFLLPVFGLLLGFLGAGKFCCTCHTCGYRWKRS